MQISQAKKEELALIISGLRTLFYQNEKDEALRKRLLAQMENELAERYDARVPA